MFSQLVPRWVPIGGFALTCAAGAINAVGFLGLGHEALSHMAGHATLLGLHAATANRALAQRAALRVLCFFAGSLLSGALGFQRLRSPAIGVADTILNHRNRQRAKVLAS